MPSLRLHPLLIAGAACLALAACGGDDDPPEASAPAQTESATTTQTAPTQTAPTQTSTTAPEANASGNDEQAAPDQADSDERPSKSDSDASTQPDASGSSKSKKAPPSPLDNYAKGGAPATKAEASAVRAILIGFQEAIGRQDLVAVCRLTIGLPEKSGPKSPMSCASLTQAGAATPPTDENRKAIATAEVVVGDNRATAEIAPGFKMPLRKIDGLWRIDYGAINNPATSSR